tara:strand:+ start:14599 stop:15537 length:939 start_codon:yes stop_codon:yes gene_type:complete
MRVDPISIILRPDFKDKSDVYFISGNEWSLIDKIKDLLIKNLTKDNLVETQSIKNIESADQNTGLFSKKKLFLVSDVVGLNKESLSLFSNSNNSFIFVSENSPKTNSIKKNLINQKNILVIDCYELNKEAKIKILNNFLNKNNLKINGNLYWDLLDMLNNKYMLLEKELDKIKEIKQKNINYETFKRIISNNEEVDDKIFFKLLDKNEIIIDFFNSKIVNNTEANKLYFMIKKFTNLIIDHEDQSDFENNIPRYLFREKKILVKIFNKFNLQKKERLIELIFNTDIIMRKNSGLSVVMSLRFLLNLKRIIIS